MHTVCAHVLPVDMANLPLPPSRAMIEALQAENADLKKNLSLAGSRQNEQKVSYELLPRVLLCYTATPPDLPSFMMQLQT